MPSWTLLSAARRATGDEAGAVRAAREALTAAEATGDADVARGARGHFVDTAIATGDFEGAWPALAAWLQDEGGLEAELRAVQWLSGQGRLQEAKQLAEGVLHAHPNSFAAQNALSDVTQRPAEAQVAT